MIEYSASQQAEFPEDKKFAARVLGVGGAGTNVLDRIALEGSEDAELMVLNTDGRSLSTSVSGDRIQLGKNLLKGMGAGGDPELGQQSALEAVDEIRHAVRGQDMVFVCVGLGGGTGSGAGPEVCRIAREEGVFLVVFATMPFSFE
ncbi:MAG: cell division protein FtsZ, partial [Verrucomicrobiales bacterium]